MARPAGLSWRAKLALLLAAFSILPTLAIAYSSFEILVETYEDSTLRSLRGLAAAKAEAIDQFTEVRTRSVERIAGLITPHLLAYREARQEAGPAAELAPSAALPKLKDAEQLAAKPATPRRPVPIRAADAAASDAAVADGAVADASPPARPRPQPRQAPSAQLGQAGPPAPGAPVPKRQQAVGEAFTTLKQNLGLILWDQRDFEELMVLDTEGRVVASTFEGHEGTTGESLEYFQRGRAATYVQPVFMSPLTEQLTMVIATPIRDEKLQELGVLVARLNLTRFFQLINDTTGLGETGETVVVKKIEETLSFMAPTRHDSEAALKRKVPVDDETAHALQEGARGQAGAGLHTDYRGKATLAAWQSVPSLDWGLIVKIDREEALKPVDDARARILLVVIVMILLIIPASILAARFLVEPLRKLKEATDRISRGDFAVQLDIRSGDEIGELADSFERMVAAIKYFRERREEDDDVESDKERLKTPPPSEGGR